MKSSWTWKRIRLCWLTDKKALHPVTFYLIQLSALSPQHKDFLIKLQTTGGENDFFVILSLAKMWVVGLTCYSQLSLP